MKNIKIISITTIITLFLTLCIRFTILASTPPDHIYQYGFDNFNSDISLYFSYDNLYYKESSIIQSNIQANPNEINIDAFGNLTYCLNSNTVAIIGIQTQLATEDFGFVNLNTELSSNTTLLENITSGLTTLPEGEQELARIYQDLGSSGVFVLSLSCKNDTSVSSVLFNNKQYSEVLVLTNIGSWTDEPESISLPIIKSNYDSQDFVDYSDIYYFSEIQHEGFSSVKAVLADTHAPIIGAYTYTQKLSTTIKTAYQIAALVSVTDDHDSNPTVSIIGDTYTGNSQTPGIYYLTLKAVDSSGNISTATINVVVEDDVYPTFRNRSNEIVAPGNGIYSLISIDWSSDMTAISALQVLSKADLTYDDNVAIDRVEYFQSSDYLENFNKYGSYCVNVRIVDTSENYEELSFTIKINEPSNIKKIQVAGKNVYYQSEKVLLNVDCVLTAITMTPGDYESAFDLDLSKVISENNYSSNYNVIGDYTIIIKCYASESIKSEVYYTVTIHVIDTTAPSFSFNSNYFTIYTDKKLSTAELTAYFIDNGYFDPSSQTIELDTSEYDLVWNTVTKCAVPAIINDNEDDNAITGTLFLNIVEPGEDSTELTDIWANIQNFFNQRIHDMTRFFAVVKQKVLNVYNTIKKFFNGEPEKQQEEAITSSSVELSKYTFNGVSFNACNSKEIIEYIENNKLGGFYEKH